MHGFQCQQKFLRVAEKLLAFKWSLFQYLTSVANDAISIMTSIIALANLSFLCSMCSVQNNCSFLLYKTYLWS